MAFQANTGAINMAVAINNAVGITKSLVEAGQITNDDVPDTIQAWQDRFLVDLTEAAGEQTTQTTKAKGGSKKKFEPKPKATSETPADEKFNFGKYKGDTVAEVAAKDLPYLEWIRDNNKWNIVTEYFDQVQSGTTV